MLPDDLALSWQTKTIPELGYRYVVMDIILLNIQT
jgi:hypothetical protein